MGATTALLYGSGSEPTWIAVVLVPQPRDGGGSAACSPGMAKGVPCRLFPGLSLCRWDAVNPKLGPVECGQGNRFRWRGCARGEMWGENKCIYTGSISCTLSKGLFQRPVFSYTPNLSEIDVQVTYNINCTCETRRLSLATMGSPVCAQTGHDSN
eukprot:633114-Prorocentrum_minimum.AAC.3